MIHKKIYYNPFIQFFIVESIKLNAASMVSLKSESKTTINIIAASGLLTTITLLPVFFFYILFRK